MCFIENQGRENLYDLKLPDGNIIRTIQPVRDDLSLGDTVHWAIKAKHILIFDQQGDRLHAAPATFKKLVNRANQFPLCIAHRGASGHKLENTLEAFAYAAKLNAEMWEIDVRLTADGTCVVSHDDNLMHTAGIDADISKMTYKALQQHVLFNGEQVPTFEQVLALAIDTDCGLYIELKGEGAGLEVLRILDTQPYENISIGSFIPEWVAELDQHSCPYPLSVLVRVGDCPFEQAEKAKADMIHLCWERASDTPHQLLTPALMDKAENLNLPVIIWHEERPSEIEKLINMPVVGICSDLLN